MKNKAIVILFSLAAALVLLSGGFGQWEKSLLISGDITVIEPTPTPTPTAVAGAPELEITPTPTPASTSDMEAKPTGDAGSPSTDISDTVEGIESIGEDNKPGESLEETIAENQVKLPDATEEPSIIEPVEADIASVDTTEGGTEETVKPEEAGLPENTSGQDTAAETDMDNESGASTSPEQTATDVEDNDNTAAEEVTDSDKGIENDDVGDTDSQETEAKDEAEGKEDSVEESEATQSNE